MESISCTTNFWYPTYKTRVSHKFDLLSAKIIWPARRSVPPTAFLYYRAIRGPRR